MWSSGNGHRSLGDLLRLSARETCKTVKRLVDKDPSIVRSQHAYRTPLYFAVRENQLEVASFLLEHGADPLGLAVNDSLLDICRDRGYAELEKLLEAKLASTQGASPEAKPSPRRSASATWKKCEACSTPRPSFCMPVTGDPISRSTGP